MKKTKKTRRQNRLSALYMLTMPFMYPRSPSGNGAQREPYCTQMLAGVPKNTKRHKTKHNSRMSKVRTIKRHRRAASC